MEKETLYTSTFMEGMKIVAQRALVVGDVVHIVGQGRDAAKADDIIESIHHELTVKMPRRCFGDVKYSTRMVYMYLYVGADTFISLVDNKPIRIKGFDRPWIRLFEGTQCV